MRIKFVLTLSLLLAVMLPATFGHAQRGREVRIRVIVDGPWERNEPIYTVIRNEILGLVGQDYTVTFSPDELVAGDFTFGSVSALVDDALADPTVDLLLSAGPMATHYVSTRGPLPKPVVAPWALNRLVQGLPYDNGTSGVDNLNYITYVSDVTNAIAVYRELVPFDRLTLMVNQGLSEAIPELSSNLVVLAEGLGLEVDLVAVSSVDGALAALGPDTEAVFITPLIELRTEAALQELIDGLTERGVPTFSGWGGQDVEAGMLATVYPDDDTDRLARRIALNMQRILDGENAGTLPVDFSRSQTLILNMSTARAIGVSPNWAILTEAVIIDPRRRTSERLTVLEAAEGAVEANLDLLAEAYGVAASQERANGARAPLLPQIDIEAVGRVIDVDRARAAFGSAPQYLVSGSAVLSQLIYAEGAWANRDIAERLALSDEQVRQQLRLEIIAETTQAYLNVLRALTVERIQRENLALTRTNLELAQVREAIGVSGPADVFRFQSEIAANRQAVIDANAQRNLAEIALNRLMHRPSEAAFTPVDPQTYSADVTTAPRYQGYLNNPASFRVFREFMVQEALANSPELRQIDELIGARERELVAAERAYYLPVVAIEGDLSFVEGFGEGSESGFDLPPTSPIQISSTEPDAINWTVALVATLPIYTGGERRSTERRIDQELAQLRTQRAAVAERIEQNTRSSLHLAGASFAGIGLARDAAAAAQSNLELVTDSYARGVAAIPQLLDAQNAAVVSAEAAANAVYDYLGDQVVVQRAVGAFTVFQSTEDQDQFRERLEAYFAERGLDPQRPPESPDVTPED